MKRTNRFTLSLISSFVLMMAFLTGTIFSQPVPKNRPDPKIKEEIKAFVVKNVIPELSVWKGKFDKALSKEDFESLNKIRARVKELKKSENAKMQTLMEERKKEKPADKEAMAKEREALRDKMTKERDASKEKMMAVGKELRPLADKYQSVLKEIGAEAKPKFEAWKEEVKKISEKYPEPENRRSMPMGILGLNDKNTKKLTVMFMLWDGGELLPADPEKGMPAMSNQIMGMNDFNWNDIASGSYPNPIVDNSIIKFNMKAADKATITISDTKGTVVKTITDDFAIGEHTVVFNTKDKYSVELPIGSYTYKIVSKGINKAGKLVLTK